MARQAENILRKHLPSSVSIRLECCHLPESQAVATGTGINLVAQTTTHCLFGGTGIGRKGKSAEDVGKDAAEQLLTGITQMGCVDEHLQDQVCLLGYLCWLTKSHFF